MRKLLVFIAFTIFITKSYSQELTGGSGICVVTGDPNGISDLSSLDPQVDCTTAYNEINGDRWKYYPQRPLGDRWLLESNGVDTNIDSIDIHQGNLRIREAGDFYEVPINEIVSVNSVSAGTSNVTITETVPDSGDWIVNMTETPIQVIQNGNDITITDQLGNPHMFSLNPAPSTTILPQGDISITQPSPNTYLIGFTETTIQIDQSVAGQVTLTDESGNPHTWQTASTGVASLTGAGDISVVEAPAGSGNYVISFTHNRSSFTVDNGIATHDDGYGNTESFPIGGGGSSSTLEIHGSYENDADAAANGCPLGGLYELDVTNTLGGSVGDLRIRKF